MMTIEKILASDQIETDELGRIVIKDKALLDNINGAIAGTPGLVLSDGACGNSNCVC